MKATLIKKTDLKVGDETVLGTVTEIKPSKSGKTMTVTVQRDGHQPFTDRVTTAGNMYIFNA